MTAMRHISEDLLTPLPRFIWLDHPCLTYCDAPISTESGVVGSDAAGLHPQSETDQPAIVDLEGFFRGLGHFPREQVRSNDGAHSEISSSGSREVDAWGVEAPSQFFEG